MEIKCPNCGKSHYIEHYSTTTALYYPPIWREGKNVNPDGNYTTTHCTCCKCYHDFNYQVRYGELISIDDMGLNENMRFEKLPTDDITASSGKDTTITGTFAVNLTGATNALEQKVDELLIKVKELERMLSK